MGDPRGWGLLAQVLLSRLGAPQAWIHQACSFFLFCLYLNHIG